MQDPFETNVKKALWGYLIMLGTSDILSQT